MKKSLLKIKNYFTNNPSKKYTLMSLIISAVLVIGASYALVTSDIFMGKKHSIIAGKLVITFTESNGVFTLNNSIPLTDAQGLEANNNIYSFTINNTGNVDASYRIRVLDETVSANKLDIEKIRYALRINNGKWSFPATLFNSDLGRTLWDGYIDVDEVLNIDVKFWIDINTTTSDMGKTFSGKISVDSVQLVEDGYTDALAPTITLAGDTNVNLLLNDTFTDAGVSSIIDPVEGPILISNVKKLYEYYDGDSFQEVQEVDTTKKGVYFITYSVANAVGNVGSTVRIVTVSTNAAIPMITLSGSATLSTPRGTLYQDAGVTAEDASSNSITDSVKQYGFVNPNVGGEYNIKYAVKDTNDNYNGVVRKVSVLWAKYIYNYTGGYQTFKAPYTGWYEIEAWGAKGGKGMDNGVYTFDGGLGGYTSGKINLQEGDNYYIYVGGTGADALDNANGGAGGYNGGGTGGDDANVAASANEPGGGGGGATDIRYFGSTTPNNEQLAWNSPIGLNSRIMVAAGGGGSANGSVGGIGGGLVSPQVERNINDEITTGSSQIVAGCSYGDTICSQFGIAATAGSANSGGGGGGGGYYGGGSGTGGSGGTGGSSFISGHAGVNAITKGTLTNNPRTYTNNTLHYNNRYFIDTEMQAGANTGNGKVEIRYLGPNVPTRINTALDGVQYIKNCVNGNSTGNGYNQWMEIQAISNGNNVALNGTISGTSLASSTRSYDAIINGDALTLSADINLGSASETGNQCVIVNLGAEYDLDEIAIWHWWKDNRTYYENVTSVKGASGSTYTTVLNNSYQETSEGNRIKAY